MEISSDVAQQLIAEAAKNRGTEKYQKVREARLSSFGTESFCAHLNDGKGILYCHTTSSYSGKVFCVGKGIGYYYKSVLGGASSCLGLPVTDEYESGNGNKASDFEGSGRYRSLHTFAPVSLALG